MGYDEKGLGVSELSFIALNYPEIYEVMMNEPEEEQLKTARKVIKAHNENMIDK